MALVPMASYSFTKEQLESRFATRPPDIAIFTSIFVDDQGMIDFVRGLAEAFPDRKILLEVKWNFVDRENGKRYIAACTEGLSNVLPVRESVYDLFFKARYAFSDPSSVVYEGMQLGVFSFAVDVVEEQKVSNFREFPGLTVSSSEDAVERIRSIEMGEWGIPDRVLQGIGRHVRYSVSGCRAGGCRTARKGGGYPNPSRGRPVTHRLARDGQRVDRAAGTPASIPQVPLPCILNALEWLVSDKNDPARMASASITAFENLITSH